MTTDLQIVQDDLFSRTCKLDETGLTFTRVPSFEEWKEITVSFIALAHRSLWIAGDAIRAGEQMFGEDAFQIIDPLHYNLKTIQNAAWVCGVIPSEKRRAELSFSHHETVAALNEKDREKLLTMAVEEKLSVSDLRKEAKEVKATYPGAKAKKAKEEKEQQLPVIDVNTEDEVLKGMDAIIDYFKKYESDGHKLSDFNTSRKNELGKRLIEFRKISRRMGVLK